MRAAGATSGCFSAPRLSPGVTALPGCLTASTSALSPGYPTFVGLHWEGCRSRVVGQGGSWPLLPVVPRTTNFLPRGLGAKSLGLGFEPSPPTRLRVRSRLRRDTARHADPRCSSPSLRFGSASVSTHRSGRSVPARSGEMALVARGADLATSLPSARVLRERREERLWVGGEEPPGGWGGHGLRRPRGPQRAEPGWGIGDAVLCGHRGAPPRDALLGRGLRSLGATRAGASKRREAAHPPGKESLTQ